MKRNPLTKLEQKKTHTPNKKTNKQTNKNYNSELTSSSKLIYNLYLQTGLSHKAPSTVLFNPKKEFHSFGYEAEDKYNKLTDDRAHYDWYCFTTFKMLLYNAQVNVAIGASATSPSAAILLSCQPRVIGTLHLFTIAK